MPILPNAEVRRGDIFEIAGRPDQVSRAAALLGHAESPGGQSDLAYHALGIVAGTLLGLASVVVGGIPITLGVGEPFTTTLTVAAYFALLFALPVLTGQFGERGAGVMSSLSGGAVAAFAPPGVTPLDPSLSGRRELNT